MMKMQRVDDVFFEVTISDREWEIIQASMDFAWKNLYKTEIPYSLDDIEEYKECVDEILFDDAPNEDNIPGYVLTRILLTLSELKNEALVRNQKPTPGIPGASLEEIKKVWEGFHECQFHKQHGASWDPNKGSIE